MVPGHGLDPKATEPGAGKTGPRTSDTNLVPRGGGPPWGRRPNGDQAGCKGEKQGNWFVPVGIPTGLKVGLCGRGGNPPPGPDHGGTRGNQRQTFGGGSGGLGPPPTLRRSFRVGCRVEKTLTGQGGYPMGPLRKGLFRFPRALHVSGHRGRWFGKTSVGAGPGGAPGGRGGDGPLVFRPQPPPPGRAKPPGVCYGDRRGLLGRPVRNGGAPWGPGGGRRRGGGEPGRLFFSNFRRRGGCSRALGERGGVVGGGT